MYKFEQIFRDFKSNAWFTTKLVPFSIKLWKTMPGRVKQVPQDSTLEVIYAFLLESDSRPL